MAEKRGKRWFESGPLPRWMRLYALWLTDQGGELTGTRAEYRGRYPTGEERAAKATGLCGRPIRRQSIPVMEKREDFREYFDRLQTDSRFLAQELARQQVTKNFKAREKALQKALDEQPDGTVGENADVRAVESFTRPYLEHAMPKQKLEKEEQAPRIVINLVGASPEQKRLIAMTQEEMEADVIDYEIIENDKLLTDGED